MMTRDKTHASHIGSQGINLVNIPSSLQTRIPSAQVEQLKFVCIGNRELRELDIDTAHPVALTFEVGNQVMADKATSASHQYSFGVRHNSSLLICLRMSVDIANL